MVIKKEMEMEDLGEELLEEIFSRVHLKPLTRMKCVSKDWCRLISHITKSRLRLNHFGLIWLDTGMLEEEWEELLEFGVDPKSRTHIRLFDVSVQGGHLEYLENIAFRFTLDDSYSSLCFSNGLLLCKELFNFEDEPILYDVSLKQLIHLPSVAEFICGHTICMGLAFDGLPNCHFKLVCSCFNGNIDFSYYVIFSSETGEWKKHRARVSNYSSKDNHNVPSRNERFSGPFLQYECLFHKGLIYWALYGYFIVYNLEDDFFEIHDLPKTQHSENECLWVSEGCLHYACSDKDGFSIWTRVRGVEIYSDDEYFKNEDNRLVLQHDVGSWKLKHTIELSFEEPYIIRFLKPCAFDEDFQILYLENLELSISLLSCSIETGCLREVKKM